MKERIRQLEAKLEEQARINDELRNEKSFLEGECNRLAGELTMMSGKLKAAEESKNLYLDWYNKEEVKKSEALLVLSSVSGILTAYLGKNK